jgi:hypothetical protein
MPFGATPVWPWMTSKKPTPVIVATPLSLLKDDVALPHDLASAALAEPIAFRAQPAVPRVQALDGNSTIIVKVVCPGCATTR